MTTFANTKHIASLFLLTKLCEFKFLTSICKQTVLCYITLIDAETILTSANLKCSRVPSCRKPGTNRGHCC